MFKRKLVAGILCTCMMATALSGCGKKEEVTTADTQGISEKVYEISSNTDSMVETPEEDVTVTKDGMVRHDLTGAWITPEEAEKRYIAIMVNNIAAAMPQSGIENADVIYEMLEEGGITRLMVFFSNYEDIPKIGPVRSARDYYQIKALEYNAILTHWGASVYAEEYWTQHPSVSHVDLNGKDNRSAFRVQRPGYALEHTGYTSGELINKSIEADGYVTKKEDSYTRMFDFNDTEKAPDNGKDATKIHTNYNASRTPWFEYDSETKLYKRFQYGVPQIDDETGNQLTFKNVIVQFAPHASREDDIGSINIDLLGSGKGYYASDGKIIPIKWEKTEFFGVTKFYTEDGEKLKLNPGKTWVTVFPDTQVSDIVIE
ncbi:MAG: DUF3048 domain-containing protein [Eubacterium sp.]|nr:DUF3048 domain-containing protein [Eubacterium sp.]